MDTKELNQFLHEFQKESDRAAAVLAGCYLDEMLELLLKKFLIQDSKFIEKYILGNSPSVAIDSFGKKTRIAYALGLLREVEYSDLETVRRIRNEFAHQIHGLSFETQKINDLCFNLKLAQIAIEKVIQDMKYTDGARFRYTITVGILGNFISHRALYETESREVCMKPLC